MNEDPPKSLPRPGDPSPTILGVPPPPRGPPLLPPRRPPARTRLRNRRFAALRELQKGDYFSQEQMRLRAPGLFHHYIGRLRLPKGKTRQNDSKNRPQNPENPTFYPENPKFHPENPQFHPESPKISSENPKFNPKNAGKPEILRELLLRALEETPEEEEEEEEAEEEEELPDEAEQELLRLEFTTLMYQRFLEGQDRDFDYSQVDENPELDNLDIVSRDLEERYFDEEEPSEAPNVE